MTANSPDPRTSHVRRVLRNFGFLTLGKTAGDVLTFCFLVALSRVLGQEAVGQYSIAMALAGFVFVFSDFGLAQLSVKEMSGRRFPVDQYYGQIMSLRFVLTAAVLSSLLLLLPLLTFSPETKLIIAILGTYTALYSLVAGFGCIMVAHEEMHLAALVEFLVKGSVALAGSVVILGGGSIAAAATTFPVVTLALFFATYAAVTRKYGRPKLRISLMSLRRDLKRSVPYGVSELLYQLFSRVDVIFLAFILGELAAGIYYTAYRVVFLLMFIPYFAGRAFLPVVSRMYANGSGGLDALYRNVMNMFVLVGVPVSTVLWWVGPDLIRTIFGENFRDSGILLRYLAPLFFLFSLRTIVGIFLTSCDRQVEATRSQWIATLLNIAGNATLIPTLGIVGAAISTVLAELLLVILLAARIKEVVGSPRIGSRLAISGVGAIALSLPIVAFPSLPVLALMVASILLYPVTLMCFKGIREREGHLLLELVKGHGK